MCEMFLKVTRCWWESRHGAEGAAGHREASHPLPSAWHVLARETASGAASTASSPSRCAELVRRARSSQGQAWLPGHQVLASPGRQYLTQESKPSHPPALRPESKTPGNCGWHSALPTPRLRAVRGSAVGHLRPAPIPAPRGEDRRCAFSWHSVHTNNTARLDLRPSKTLVTLVVAIRTAPTTGCITGDGDLGTALGASTSSSQMAAGMGD